MDGDFTFDAWAEGLRSGRTFVTSGPMLDLTVNGAQPGERLEMSKGDLLTISAVALGQESQIPLSRLELVVHGKVMASLLATTESEKERLAIETEIPLEHGIWVAARCQAGPGQMAHTTPVYVEVDGGGFHNPETVLSRLELSERYLDEIEAELENPGTRLDNQIFRFRDAETIFCQISRCSMRAFTRSFGLPLASSKIQPP